MNDPCTYCHGIRLVGWSGAGPILCPECSRGQDAFTVITQAWREQRAMAVGLSRENATLRSNSDHLSAENASLSRQVDSMAMHIESLAAELAKPEDVRLREVLDALDGRAVIFDGLGARVAHVLDELDEWIDRAGEAEREQVRLQKVLDVCSEVHAHNVALKEERDRLRKALRGAPVDLRWQCSGCGWAFACEWQKVCPCCKREDYWTGSVFPDAKLWDGSIGTSVRHTEQGDGREGNGNG